MICSSSPVPSVVTISPCVSPRVNSAEPCVRGRMPTSHEIGRTVVRSRPSMRRPVLMTSPRSTADSSFLKTLPSADSLARSSSDRPALIVSRAAEIAVWRSCLSRMAKAARIGSSPSSFTRA